MKYLVTYGLLLSIALTGVLCPAAVLVSEASDAASTSAGGVDQATSSYTYAGYRGSHYAPVFVFQLPARAEGMIVDPDATDFAFNVYLNSSNPGFNLDVYGVRYSSSSTVLGSDYGSGDLLYQDIMLSTDAPGRYSTDSSGDRSVAGWIDDQYDAGAEAGDYVFVMLMPDSFDTSWANVRILMNEWTTPAERPELTMDFTEAPAPIPEPASLGLIALSFACIWMVRRRS